MPRLLISLAVLFVVTSMPAAAQPLGTFTWQLQPYCNVLRLAVTQNGTTFTLDGVDDLCGAGPASAVGTAFFKTDETVGMGLHLVTAPGATPVHITVVLNPATLNGAWTDSGGHSGTLLFNPPPPPVGGRPAAGGWGTRRRGRDHCHRRCGPDRRWDGPGESRSGVRGDRVGTDRRTQRPHAREGPNQHGGGGKGDAAGGRPRSKQHSGGGRGAAECRLRRKQHRARIFRAWIGELSSKPQHSGWRPYAGTVGGGRQHNGRN